MTASPAALATLGSPVPTRDRGRRRRLRARTRAGCRWCIASEGADMTASPAALETLDSPFLIGGREFRSRLMVGTGKYASNEQMIAAIEASGAEVVTVAVRRVDLDRTRDEGILYHLDPQRFMLLANTAGCFTADDT